MFLTFINSNKNVFSELLTNWEESSNKYEPFSYYCNLPISCINIQKHLWEFESSSAWMAASELGPPREVLFRNSPSQSLELWLKE